MAGTLPGIHRRHFCGGSLALARLLDDYGEEIWLDLKATFGFDLVGFLAGEVPGSPRLILAMIGNLPEGTRYVATLTSAREQSGDTANESVDDSPPDPVMEHMMWTSDRVLMAQLINSVNTLVKYSIEWSKVPDIPIVGPSSWRESKQSSKSTSLMDVINRITGQHG